MKRLCENLKKFLKIYILGFLGYIVTYLIYKSIKWKIVFEDDKVYDNFPDKGVVVFWHAHQLLMAPIAKKIVFKKKGAKAYVLISKHSDGRLIANVMKYYGIDSVAGSSSANSKGASLSLLKKLEIDNSYIAITPDGPKGPNMVAKLGAATLASLSKSPIIPFSYDFKDKWTFKSWDKMFLPKPFTNGTLVIGRLIYVKENLSDDERECYRKQVEDELNRICKVATNDVNNVKEAI